MAAIVGWHLRMPLCLSHLPSPHLHLPFSRVVVDDLWCVGLVEASSQVGLSDSQTNGVANTLTQRACATLATDT
jgi:hypothetical protein